MSKDAKPTKKDPFAKRAGAATDQPVNKDVHFLNEKKRFVCRTDKRGHQFSGGRSPLEIVVDASGGFIPLWERDTTLRWRFNEVSMNYFESPPTAKRELRKLFGECLLAWDFGAPVKFAERADLWDFEIQMQGSDDCDAYGCTLASAFFPDGGRHKLKIYPKFFTQTREEQVETLIHEIGHIFGLRHFFANISENNWPSQIFGVHDKFSIMNYGNLSQLTNNDKSDLARLYQSVWTGQLKEINGTPIKLVKPYHSLREFGPSAFVGVRSRNFFDGQHAEGTPLSNRFRFSSPFSAFREASPFDLSVDTEFVNALWFTRLSFDNKEQIIKAGATWESRDLKFYYQTEALARDAADSVMKQAIGYPYNDLTNERWREFHNKVKLATKLSAAISDTVEIAVTAQSTNPIP